MKVLFTVPHLRPSGGVKVIYRLADLLINKGAKTAILAHKIKNNDASVGWLAKHTPRVKIISKNDFNKVDMSQVTHIVEFGDTIPLPNFYNAMHILYLQGYGTQNMQSENKNLRYNYDYVITTSRWLQHVSTGFGHKKVYVIHPGVDAMFNPIGVSKNYNLQQYFTIGCLYHEAKDKGLSQTIDALNLLINRIRFKCIFFAAKFPTSIDKFEKNVNFPYSFVINPVQETIPNMYTQCDIWLSLCKREGFGLPILEAMACKCPVVMIKNSGLDEYIVDGHNCKLIKNETSQDIIESILHVIKHTEYRNKIIENGYKLAKKVTWEKTVNNFFDILQKVKKP